MTIERELEVQPITSYLTKLVVSTHFKAREHQSQRTITNARSSIRTITRARTKKLTPQEELEQWITREDLNDEAYPQVTTENQKS